MDMVLTPPKRKEAETLHYDANNNEDDEIDNI